MGLLLKLWKIVTKKFDVPWTKQSWRRKHVSAAPTAAEEQRRRPISKSHKLFSKHFLIFIYVNYFPRVCHWVFRLTAQHHGAHWQDREHGRLETANNAKNAAKRTGYVRKTEARTNESRRCRAKRSAPRSARLWSLAMRSWSLVCTRRSLRRPRPSPATRLHPSAPCTLQPTRRAVRKFLDYHRKIKIFFLGKCFSNNCKTKQLTVGFHFEWCFTFFVAVSLIDEISFKDR